MSDFDEDECLRVDPFAGDFGDPGDRVLRNRIVTARKSGPCQDCAQTIVPGERVRSLAAVFDGDVRSYRWCALCCAAMTADDDGEAMEARIGLRHNFS